MIGRTSDMGAYSITLLTDDGKQREYPHSQSELDDLFGRLAEMYCDAGQAPS